MKKIILSIIMVVFSITVVNAQDKITVKKDTKGNIFIKVKEGANPVIYVDGKVFDFPMELIDQTKIASVMVLKDQEAIKKYNAPNGVVFIQTKKAGKSFNIRSEKDSKKAPMIIIDGKVSDEKFMQQLKPDDIKNIEILKGEKALEKYNAPNGVILITTKKK